MQLQVDVEALHGAGQDVTAAAATLRATLTTAGSGLAPAPRPDHSGDDVPGHGPGEC
ncbi:hypothetical protein [Actinoplanes awajinensis]|uniref:hypothetical protein n=1 Tax=Actinoplanes awajinensis TaxID=135946 RepID=UPI0030846BE0